MQTTGSTSLSPSYSSPSSLISVRLSSFLPPRTNPDLADRLNWWPSTLGGSFSYFVFWSLSVLIGFLLHKFDLDGLGRHAGKQRGDDTWDWERKTTWVALAFATMTMPALACFAKLRADRRQSYRRSLTAAQKTYARFVSLEASRRLMLRTDSSSANSLNACRARTSASSGSFSP